MKKITFIVLAFAIIGFNKISAQISQGGLPPSYTISALQNKSINEVHIGKPDLPQIKAEDAIRDANGEKPRYAVSIFADISPMNSGTWTELENGDKVWRIKITTEGAIGIGVYYDQFWLPVGGELFVYNENKSQLLGAYTEVNNHESMVFANEAVEGESVILEYYQPATTKEIPIIHINEIAYGYRMMYFPNKEGNKGFGDSEYCEVNINCSEGNAWQTIKKGVARISIKIGSGYYWCTGTLVNNVRQDCTPYFLTACHCGHGASGLDLNQWVFYFHYEAAGCSNPAVGPSATTMVGASLKATDGNDGQNGSDFFLVKLNSNVPVSHDLYFNGWNRANSASTSGVGIHHPAGDIKKISTYTQNLSSVYVGAPGSHWRVYWSSTANGHGVTEQGSSGSPLFNSSKLIVGTLTGGSSYCYAPNDPDYYGKFSYSWANNGSNSSKRLKDWLDPDGTNTLSLNGRTPCSNPGMEENPSINNVRIFPNPAINHIIVDLSEVSDVESISVSNALGEIVIPNIIPSPSQTQIDLSQLSAGVYFIHLNSKEGTYSKKISVLK